MSSQCDKIDDIFQGESVIITASFVDDETGANADLSTVTEIFLIMDNNTGGKFTKKQSDAPTELEVVVGSPEKLKITLTKEETKLLKVSARSSMVFAFDFPSPINRKFSEIKDAVSVKEFTIDLDAL